MPEGGRIEIRGRPVRASFGPEEGPALAKKAEMPAVEWTVSDTGVGIPEKHVRKIFNPFFTTKPDGSGLGLAVVYKIVEKHGGRISVESVVGRGTTFRILVPAEGRQGSRAAAQA
jgi:signal transduction histidine kinase